MPSRIGNYGNFPGDRRDPENRPGYGNHPPACTCYRCVEERRKVEARRIAEAADQALRYGPREASKPAEKPSRTTRPPKPPKPKKERRQKPPKAKKEPKPKRELPERTEEQKARDAKLGYIILAVLAVLAVLVLVGAVWGTVFAVAYVREQVSGWSVPEVPEVSLPDITVPSQVTEFSLPEISLPEITVPSQVTEFSLPEISLPEITLPSRAAAEASPLPTLTPAPATEPAAAHWDISLEPKPTPELPYMEEIERHIVTYTNIYREQMGRAPLRHDDELAAVARAHSENMAGRGKLRHVLDGQSPTDRGFAAGYGCRIRTGIAENILHFPASRNSFKWPWSDKSWDPYGTEHNPEVVARLMVESWIDSALHRANLLGSSHRSFGVGVASDFSVKGTATSYEYFYVTQKFTDCK